MAYSYSHELATTDRQRRQKMATFNVLVKDGQGCEVRATGLKNATKQARSVLRCKKSDLRFITIGTESGEGFSAYLFDGTQADVEYWIAALKPTTPILASGPIPE